jgi:hypothetical protein
MSSLSLRILHLQRRHPALELEHVADEALQRARQVGALEKGGGSRYSAAPWRWLIGDSL